MKSKVHTYCSFVSYIGTKFKGSQRQIPRRNIAEQDETKTMTIQQALDDSLFHIVPKPDYTSGRKTLVKLGDDQIIQSEQSNENKDKNSLIEELKKKRFIFDDNDLFGFRTFITSRTDAGVCSTMNCYLFDLIHPTDKFYKPDHLTMMMNRHMSLKKYDVIVNKTIVFNKPSMNFEIVKAKQYCYRLAFLKPELLNKSFVTNFTFLNENLKASESDALKIKRPTKPIELEDYYTDSLNAYALYSFVPINELNRCLILNSKYSNYENNQFVERTIDVEKMREAAKLFYGKFDFTTFSTKNNRTNSIKTKSPIKTLSRFEFKERNVSDDSLFDSRYNNFKFYDVYVKADGFLYNQIRRMMGCLLAHGFGLITQDDIRFMLENPMHSNFNNNCVVVPGTGLYLNKIDFQDSIQEHLFSEEELILEEDKI